MTFSPESDTVVSAVRIHSRPGRERRSYNTLIQIQQPVSLGYWISRERLIAKLKVRFEEDLETVASSRGSVKLQRALKPT